MKPYQYAAFWLAGFVSYLLIVFAGYALIPEGTLLEIAQSHSPYISGEDWDNFMGYLIFIGSGVLNGALIWLSMAAIKSRNPNHENAK
ncbi:hypothetical protein [Pseudomonas panipatensis]|uniref:hypothetical protein n=1 Tax=Pseudomonas panipatensis TaxID=428992 RepID=UPI0035B0F2C7